MASSSVSDDDVYLAEALHGLVYTTCYALGVCHIHLHEVGHAPQRLDFTSRDFQSVDATTRQKDASASLSEGFCGSETESCTTPGDYPTL